MMHKVYIFFNSSVQKLQLDALIMQLIVPFMEKEMNSDGAK